MKQIFAFRTSSNQLSSNGNYGPKVSSNHPSPHSDIREPTTNGSLDRIAVYSDYSGTTAEGIVNTSEVRANLTGLISKEDDRDIDRSIDRSFEDSPSGMIDESNEDLSLSSSLVHEPSLRAALHEAYVDLDRGIEQPSLEYEETWKSEMYEVIIDLLIVYEARLNHLGWRERERERDFKISDFIYLVLYFCFPVR